MRWHGNRYHERWTFRRVKWPGMEEAEDYGQITGGKSSESQFKELKATGSIDYEGSTVPDEDDAVRVYYGFTDDAGESWEGPVVTGFLELGETDLDGSLVSGSADLSGMLTVAASTGPGYPLTLPAGTPTVETAAGFLRALGLVVNAAPSSHRLSSAHTFERDEKWLGIANWLLSAADFGSATTDAWGAVQMQPYVEPTERAPSWTFRDDETSVFFPSVTVRDNRADTPNVVRLWYEDDNVGLYAEARNDDPRSAASTVTCRRERQLDDEVTELSGDTPEKMLEALKAAARKRLLDNSTRIDYVEVHGLFIPSRVGECGLLDYREAGVEQLGGITAKDVEFGLGGETTHTMRRLLRPDFKVTTAGEVVWRNDA